MHFKTVATCVLAAGSLNAVLAAPMGGIHTPCATTTTTTHTPCSSSAAAAAEALNVSRQAVDWAATPTASSQQATPALETSVLAPSAPTVSPPLATPTYTYEETHRPAPDHFGLHAAIATLSVLGGVILFIAVWAVWSHRRGGKPFACFGSCCGRGRKLDDESIAVAERHYPCSDEVELMPARTQQWPGRGRSSVRAS
jgi:hypothetical protein